MADQEKSKPTPGPENQAQRWVKYGSNVALATIVVILLAGLIIFIAQRNNQRIDTTQSGAYSLKPQTVNIIRDLKSPVKLISLYEQSITGEKKSDYAQAVQDLLFEYKRKGKNIDVEIIDPVASPSKVDDLINEVTRKYGGEVQRYREFLEANPKTYEELKAISAEEAQKVKALPLDQMQQGDLYQTLMLTIATVQQLPEQLETNKQRIERRLKPPLPDYKGATESVDSSMDTVSQIADRIITDFTRFKEDQQVPQPIRQYITDSLPRYEQIKKLADDTMKKIDELGELKLDELRQRLQERNSILVLGDTEMRALPASQVWVEETNRARLEGEEQVKPRFAGEQQITSAILSISSPKKQKVAIIRPTGAPLAETGFPPFVPSGPLAEMAQRLRSYNFEVVEKDMSGTWTIQASMQGRQAEPEPSEEELKDAIWIVLAVPNPPQQNQNMPAPAELDPKLAAHLKNGGSALVLAMPNTKPFSESLDPFGIKLLPDVIAVHEPVKESGGATGDIVEQAQRDPLIFVMNEFGDHVITKSLRSLDALLVPMLIVQTEKREGVETSSILPVPHALPTWGERDIQNVSQLSDLVYNPEKDLALPLYSGAAAEKSGAGRVVAIGSLQFASNQFVTMLDPELANKGRRATRFPANSELFLNSIFWLAKMEPMIAISPAAMDVARIEPISDGALRFWRVGVLLIGLPGLVIAAGALMYFARRD